MNLIFSLSYLKLFKLLIFLAVIFSSLFFSQKVGATENFDTSSEVIYDVKDDETTRVTLNIGLTNKSSDFFAASYSVQTGFEDIKNINIKDSLGDIKFKTEKNENGIQLTFDFNEKTVGKGNTQEFSISFDTKEISKNYGAVREVNIPGLSNQKDYTTFNVEVRTPDSFGKPSIIKPKVDNLKTTQNSIYFTKKDLGNGGISIAYGDFQVYEFNLRYHITNKNLFPELTEIAIPADNNYQKVAINNIEPKPENVVIDRDGNWLARFKLLPSQDLIVIVKGMAKISYLPKSQQLSDDLKKEYLKPQEYWEVHDEKIKKAAGNLKTPQAIYEYVVKTLKYDTNRIASSQVRAGARNVLENPESAVCLEFTDLFVTLARASGIPARAVEGFANTSNTSYRPLSLVEDVLHAWPEYYDEEKKSWIMVDPTWGNTTNGIDYFNVLDFDHFAFVIKGIDSDYPIPAGGYKSKATKDQKDVNVMTANEFNQDNPVLNITTDFSKNLYGGLPISGNLIVSNDSNVLTPAQNFNVKVDGLNPQSQNLYVDEIPPYGKKVLPLSFTPVSPLTNKTFVAKISIGQDMLEKDIIVLPIYRSIYFSYILGGILSGILLFIISFIIYRTRRLHFPR